MSRKYSVLYLILFGIAFCGTAFSCPSQDGLSQEKEKRIEDFVQSFMKDYKIPGLAFAVVENNRMNIAQAFGVRNIDSKEPLDINSIFHFASVSKPFSATAIMQLVEKGKMKLDDPLVKYLPYFKLDDPRSKDITIKQMLTHTSGFPDVLDYEWDKPQFDEGAAERYVRSLGNEKMIGGPGEILRYSNMAFDVLADVIAKVSGMSFEDYIKKNILDPLGMTESDFLRERIRPELRVTAHVQHLVPQASAVYPYNRQHAPSSCLNANVVEMCAWAIANMNRGIYNGKRILDESSYNLLFEPQARSAEGRTVGLSWFLEERHGLKVIQHGGGDLGFRSYIIIIPEKSLAVVAASNFEGTPIGDVAYGLIDIMLGKEPAKSKMPVAMALGRLIAEGGVQKAIEEYRHLKNTRPDDYDFREAQLNRLGYGLIALQRLDDAVEIFKLNVEMFPQSFNVYDSLGEAYMLAGNKDLAIKNYRKSIELNPGNSNGVQALEKLQSTP